MAIIRMQGMTATWEDNVSAAQTLDLISFRLGGGASAVIADTRLASTSIQKVSGLPEAGTVSLEINGNHDDTGVVALVDGNANSATREMVIVYPSGTLTTLTFQAFVTSIDYTGELNDKLIIAIEMEVTGLIVKS